MFKYTLIKKTLGGFVALALAFASLTLPALSTARDLPAPVALTYVQGQFAQYPLDNFRVIASVQGTGNACTGADCLTVYSQKSINNGNELAAMLGVDNSQISNLVYAFPANSPVVVARHNPYAYETRIFVVKLIVAADGSRQFLISDYTPHHGQRLVAAREYMTPAERADVNRGGNNPFAGNRGGLQDPLFNQCNEFCTKVAVGHAMRQYNASIGLLAVAEVTLDSKNKVKRGLFQSTTTTTTEGFVQPHWYVATSPEFQFQGAQDAQTIGVCAVALAPGAVCAPEHRAVSGVAFIDWKGGSLSEIKELKYRNVESKSGWTLFAMALFIGALVVLAAFTGGASLGLALGVGFGTTVAYAGGYMLFGGAGLTDVQSGLFGRTSVSGPAPAATNKHQAKMNEIVRPLVAQYDFGQNVSEKNLPKCDFVNGGPTTNCYDYLQGINMVTQGTTDRAPTEPCSLGDKSQGCGSPGSMPRVTGYAQVDANKELGEKYDECKAASPFAARVSWSKCAAPLPRYSIGETN